MVAMANERPDTGGIQPLQTFNEGALGTQAAVGSIVYVAGYEQGIHLLGDAEVDDVPVGIESGRIERLGHIFRRGRPDARERTVQMEISGVDKSEGHTGTHIPFSSGFATVLVRADTMYVRPTVRSTAGCQCMPGTIRDLVSPWNDR